MIVNVYIDKGLPQIDQLYSYILKDASKDIVGKRVVVPFGRGNRREIAVVISIGNDEDYPIKKLKEVIEVLDMRPILSKTVIDLGLKIRETFLSSYVQAFQPLLPKYVLGDVEEIVIKRIVNQETDFLMGANERLPIADINKKNPEVLARAIEQGWLEVQFRSKKPIQRKIITRYEVSELESSRLTEKQRIVYDLLKEKGPLSKSDIRTMTDFSDSPIEGLIKKNIVKIAEEVLPKAVSSPVLRKDQEKAINAIVDSKRPAHLLLGDTGTGKTEVYMQLAQRAIASGKTTIIIVPEIGLATQMVDRISGRFPGKVDILHSQRSDGEKAEAWIRLKNEPGRIVVGARSAIFAPLPKLGYICIDEEQEESYDYQEGLRYDVRKVAEIRARLEGGKVVYGSATPSITTFSRTGKDLVLHRLIGDEQKPLSRSPIEIVDMRLELLQGNTDILSAEMVAGLEKTLQMKKQAILFINRRGFSHFVSCRHCGYVIQCDTCDISMVYHKKTNRLHCHYCGRTKHYPRNCPECGSEYLKQFGIGTEQVESWIRSHFPDARVFRMDKDTMSQKGKYEKLYHAMENKEIDILVGTQMLAKGFDFHNVVFVGVVAADLSLYISDYKAQEKTYQLLTQVSGRAGRGEDPGRALIQTYNTDNYSIQYAKERNFEQFYHREMEERRRFLYPPFVRMIKIHIRGTGDVETAAYNWRKTLHALNKYEHLDIQIANPVEQPKIQNRKHYSVTAKIFPEEYRALKKALKRVLMHYYQNISEKNITVTIELEG